MPPKNVLGSQLSDEVQGARRALKTFEIIITRILFDSQEQSDRNFFISCETSEQVIGHSWKELLLSLEKESINLRRASTGFAVSTSDLLFDRRKVDIQLNRVNSKQLWAGM